MAEHSGGNWWKWILALAVIAAGAGGYYYFHRESKPLLTYNTTTATRGVLTKLVTATGTLNPVVNVTVGS